jgi:hypothetical protein
MLPRGHALFMPGARRPIHPLPPRRLTPVDLAATCE